jgi:AcrR family transcriptional regulator
MQATERPPPRRADAVANRGALVRAASELYADRGLDVPFDDIAQAAGVGRATLYRHFPTREDLQLAILEGIVAEIEDAAAALAMTSSSFLRLFKAALRVQTDNLPLVDLLPPRSDASPGVRALRARVRAVFCPTLALARADGLVRADLTPEDVRVQLLMLSAVVRPETPQADQRRAWRLALAAFGVARVE